MSGKNRKDARPDAEILNEKLNRVGNQLLKQIANLKKAQRNAQKVGKDGIAKYNKVLAHFKTQLDEMELTAKTTTEKEQTFNVDEI